jgi:hypothetical protein
MPTDPEVLPRPRKRKKKSLLTAVKNLAKRKQMQKAKLPIKPHK